MNSPDQKKRSLKEILLQELVEYWINVVYLALVFAAFTQYKRLIMAAHDISYTNYGVAAIEALVLAKVIMIGSMFRLGRGLEQKPLIYPTIYKTVIFTLWVAAFKLIEHAIKILWKGNGLMGLDDYFEAGPHEFLAWGLMLFVVFIPFFGVKELGRVLGEGKIRALFFQKRAGQ